MKQYVEVGIGNTWWVRTEVESSDGTESEIQGIRPFSKIQGVYLRLWVGRTVWILSSNEGFKKMSKRRKTFKLLLGVSGFPR